MAIHAARQVQRHSRAPAWFTVAAWASLGLLLVAGFAGAVGIG